MTFGFTTPRPALANGRFPRAERLIERTGDPAQLVLAATYGLLLTRDRGQNWYYLCEKAFSLKDSYLGDPLFSWSADGSMLVGVQTSITRSQSQACGFDVALAGQAGQIIVDYALARAGTQVVALVTTLAGGGATSRLYQSLDSGASFAPIGAALPLDLAMTVDVDPTNPDRIYATGVAGGAGVFVVSTDHGASWTSHSIPGTSADEPPYIALVDPGDGDRIFVRSDAWPLIEDNQMGNDALFYSNDGGATWSEVFRAYAKLLGVALSPGSDTIVLGYGDPKTEPFVVDPTAMGIYVASTASFDFAKQYDGSITCLAWTSSGIYACTSQVERGFALGFLSNLADLAGGAGLLPLLRLPDIKGPLPCCGPPSLLLCGPVWPTACTIFNACGDAGGDPTALICTADAGTISDVAQPGGEVGATAPAPDAGSPTSDADLDAPAPGPDAAADGLGPATSSGCTCHIGSPNAGTLPFIFCVVAGWLARIARRR